MLFSTNYPSYQDPTGEQHESKPHPLSHALHKISEYVGNILAMLFVTAFTGLELIFFIAIVILALKGLSSWDLLPVSISEAVSAINGPE
jgi:hypothetical protein